MTLRDALNDENVVRRYGIRNAHYGSFSEQARKQNCVADHNLHLKRKQGARRTQGVRGRLGNPKPPVDKLLNPAKSLPEAVERPRSATNALCGEGFYERHPGSVSGFHVLRAT